MNIQKGYTFDDVLLIPQYSELDSRDEIDLYHKGLSVPIYSAPMDTVTGVEMQKAMKEAGGLGIHHRYIGFEKLVNISGAVAVSPSLGNEFLEQTMAELLVIDVAHGDSKKAIEYAEKAVKTAASDARVVSGNIVTPSAARRYWDVGVEMLKVGVGPGSVCTTREVAGVGYPQLSAIMNIREKFPHAYIIADGGIKTSGDIVKALGAGADAVMLGRLLAGVEEATGGRGRHHPEIKQFRGMASKSALKEAGKEVNVEGETEWIEVEGTVQEKINELCNGIRAGLAYCGVRNIKELQENAELVRIS